MGTADNPPYMPSAWHQLCEMLAGIEKNEQKYTSLLDKNYI
jgi:hypothetical protein